MNALFPWLEPFDRNVFFAFQGLRCPWLDYALGFPTVFGETVFLMSFAVALIACLDRGKTAEKITLVVCALLFATWSADGIKEIFGRPRPYEFWPDVTPLFGKLWTKSFPSGHAANAFSVASVLNILYGRKMRWAYVAAAWVGITRIYAGMHYPTDVLGGAVLGVLCAHVTGPILRRRKV